jgi:hypothetical protein
MTEKDELISKLQSKGYARWQIRHELCAKNDHSECDKFGHRCPQSNCAQGDHKDCKERNFQCPKIMAERNPQNDFSKFDPKAVIRTLDETTGVTGIGEFSKYTIDELIGMSLPLTTAKNDPKSIDSSGMYQALVQVLLAGVEAARAKEFIAAVEDLNSKALPSVSQEINDGANEIRNHASKIAELKTSIEAFSYGMNKLFAETKTSIDEIGKKLGLFIDTNAKLTTEMIVESKSLGRWTFVLAIMTALLAFMTAWMAWSTAELVKQEKAGHQLQEVQLKEEKQRFDGERTRFQQEKQLFETQRTRFQQEKTFWNNAPKKSSTTWKH